MIGIFLALVAAQGDAAVAATQAYPLPPAVQAPLMLTCHGGGIANKQVSDTVQTTKQTRDKETNEKKNTTTTTTVQRNIKVDFADQVDVRLFMGDDRIRVPRTMLPDLHGGNQGWFKIKNVTADARSIRGKIQLAFLSSPNLFIDRVTGAISISGNAGDYQGRCQVVDPNAPAQF